MKVAITHLVCSQRQPHELTPSLRQLVNPHVNPGHDGDDNDDDCWKALAAPAQFSYRALFFSPLLLIIQLIHVSQLTEPHYCGALSHCVPLK